jgi:hypothetical protein
MYGINAQVSSQQSAKKNQFSADFFWLIAEMIPEHLYHTL